MTYDKVKWCWSCQKPKPREGFGPVRPGSNRHSCADCLERRATAEAVIKERKAI